MFCKMYIHSVFTGLPSEIDISGTKSEIEKTLRYYANTQQLLGFRNDSGIYGPEYVIQNPFFNGSFLLKEIGKTLRGMIPPKFERG